MSGSKLAYMVSLILILPAATCVANRSKVSAIGSGVNELGGLT